MLEKPKASTTLGLEIEGNVIKGIQLAYQKGKPKLLKLLEVPLSSEHVNPLYNREPQLFEKSLVISALATQEVLIRQLEIKLKKDKDIQEVLLFQSEPLLPYPIDNAVVDYAKIGTTEDGTLLTIFAARKDHLQYHLDQWSPLRIIPEVVTAVPIALANFASFCAPSETPYCLIHIGIEQSACVLVQEANLLAAQSIPYGVLHLKEALPAKEGETANFGDIDISQLPQEGSLTQAWETLRKEIKRAVLALSKQVKSQTVQEVLITGTGALVPHLASALAEDLDMQQIFPRQDALNPLTRGQILNFAIPIGAALGGLPHMKGPINFRQQEFSYPHPWKRLKNPLLTYGGLCLGLMLAFFLFGQAFQAFHLDQNRKAYIGLLKTLNIPYENFEKEYEAKNPDEKPIQTDFKGIMDLSETDLFNRVQYLEKELKARPENFALLPNVPKVSDVLAWLSSQPTLLGKRGQKNQPVQVESFNYTMTKRPEQNKKQEKYQVKVEMEFTSPTPKQAREFHDALIAPNDFVDPKGEIKWNSSHGRYRTSFFLKDKTLYPSSS